ncbi:hypothetical protein VTK56DRAFT_9159 [Thermocarpiscus australiensis]
MHYDQLFHRSCPRQIPTLFTRFQRLPAELRNMVWEYALPEPRVYEVLDAPNAKQKTPAQRGLIFANVHAEPPPALAAVCRESRYFVLHHYMPLTLASTTKYVDMSRDILLLEPYLLIKRLHRTLHFMSQIPLVRDNTTRLALGTSYGVYPGIFHPVLGRKVSKNNMSKLLSSLAKFPRLKTLIFVVHQEFQFEFDFRFPGTMTPIPNRYTPLLPPAAASVPPGLSSGFGPPGATGYPPSPASSTDNVSAVAALSPLQGNNPTSTSTMTAPGLPSPIIISTTASPSRSPPQPPPLQAPPSLALPIPSLPAHPRPQLVHRAYRFKFDVEADVNRPPRRPHANELLYYPLDIDEDREDDWDRLMGGGGGGSSNGGEDGEDGEWCDPWPTNDDWRRFRRRFQRAMVACLGCDCGCGTEGEGQGFNRGKGCGFGNGGFNGGGGGEKGIAVGVAWKGQERVCLPELKLKGASLLWRYTRGVGGL